MFNHCQVELCQPLQNYDINDPAYGFGFTHHLMKNHHWTEKYVYRVIVEDKKIDFLCTTEQLSSYCRPKI